MNNILFVLYHDFGANSAVHVHNFANQLASFGHHVAVAVPNQKETAASLGQQSYATANFSEVDGSWDVLFPDARPPAVVHAWTPRENVRLFCEKLRGLCAFVLVVHMEDNEELILEVNLGTPFEKLARMPALRVPFNLSHPQNYRAFLRSASGVTIIMDRLEKLVPAGVPKMVLWPGANTDVFASDRPDNALARSLDIPDEATVLCYTGNVHSANAREVRSLYLAVAMLNREGFPTALVRAGRDYAPFLGPDEEWAHRHSIELGYVDHTEIGRVLSLADVLVQPGAADQFNEYRLPAKLPEFFAMGRPVILPRVNVGRFVTHGEDAWVLPKVDALGIVETLHRFHDNPELVERLSIGAKAFASEHFSWKKNSQQLDQFYSNVLADKEAVEVRTAHG